MIVGRRFELTKRFGTADTLRVGDPRQLLGGEIASRLAYTQKSRGQNLPERPLPLSVKVCTPVSETGRAGAIPAAAANLNSIKNKHLEPGDE